MKILQNIFLVVFNVIFCTCTVMLIGNKFGIYICGGASLILTFIIIDIFDKFEVSINVNRNNKELKKFMEKNK